MIIFDLDDTLIDTSGSIIPYRVEEIVHYFLRSGLSRLSFDEAYKELLELNRGSLTLEEALHRFFDKYPGKQDWLERAKKIYQSPIVDMPVQTLPLANQILNRFQQKHLLALVTYGEESFQLKKLEKAGIDRSLFSKIVVCKERNKGPYYQEIIDQMRQDPKNVLVCGDRVAFDLVPAKGLGCWTIHMKWGRGKLAHQLGSFIDWEVESLEECFQIIETRF